MATRNNPHGNAWSHHSPPKPSETTPRGERHDSSIFAHATFVRVWLTKNMGYIKNTNSQLSYAEMGICANLKTNL